MIRLLRDGRRYWSQMRAWRRLATEPRDRPRWSNFGRWQRSLRPDCTALRDESPWLTFAAIDYLDRVLTPGSRVFEWGMGGSSLFLAQRAAEVVSVEHDPQWYEIVCAAVAQRGWKNWTGCLVEAQPAPPGPVPDPADWTQYASSDPAFQGRWFRDYAQRIDCFPPQTFDLILVDGRARPACIRHALTKVKPAGVIVVDNAERDHYGPACELLAGAGLRPRRLPGPGPYNRYFWLTTAWSASPRTLNASGQE